MYESTVLYWMPLFFSRHNVNLVLSGAKQACFLDKDDGGGGTDTFTHGCSFEDPIHYNLSSSVSEHASNVEGGQVASLYYIP